MRMLPVAAALIGLGLAVAPVAAADAYTDALAAKFAPNRHVVADTAATPPLNNADKLNAQVLAVRSTPIWVAAVAPSQTGVTTPDALHASLKHNGVYLVIDAKGYHDQAFDVSSAVAGGVQAAMRSSAADHHNDPYGAVSEFVTKVAAMGHPTNLNPVSGTNSCPNCAKHTNLTWLWWTLGGIAAILACLTGIWIYRRSADKRQRREAEENTLRSDLITHQSNVDDLDNAVVDGADVSTAQRKATVALGNAKDSYNSGDYTAARAHLLTVEAAVAQADRKLHKAATPDLTAVAATPPTQRKAATATATAPSGARITINNTNYRTSRSSGYNNYYGGGMLNGMYFYPGYYPYNYWGAGWGWSPADIIMTDMLLQDRWGGNYEQGYQQGYDSGSSDVYFQDSNSTSTESDTSFDGTSSSSDSDTSFDGNSDSSSADSDTSFDGSDSSTDDSTGFDGSSDTSYAPSSDPTPSYDPPSYDPTPSYSPPDTGGGDSGWSGGDSGGGGGFDSGGGGSDF